MLRRAIVDATGLGVAMAVALAALPIGLIVMIALSPDHGHSLAAGFWQSLVALAGSDDPETAIVMAGHAIWSAAVSLCCAPILLVALVGEAARARGLAWPSGATACVTVSMPLLRAMRHDRISSDDLAGQAPVFALLAVVGAVAGFSYWLIAGQNDEGDAKKGVIQPPV